MFLPPKLIIRFVAPDGCYSLDGMRVRVASGYGEGSLVDEISKGTVTPLDTEKLRADLYKASTHQEAQDFIISLPHVRRAPCGV